ncbi:hypothetical protein BT63DRAFT_449644 [Microthyrium microscopicum]|uniref:Uncharacterized protein n=1 Tax=Microthyrium microscopicum TaxID=703497 RepID=A0A6A6UUN7_9PEZI|nr:hypothetical protein BT63DRAFT_449644 [Microthyrium microscopicum]
MASRQVKNDISAIQASIAEVIKEASELQTIVAEAAPLIVTPCYCTPFYTLPELFTKFIKEWKGASAKLLATCNQDNDEPNAKLIDIGYVGRDNLYDTLRETLSYAKYTKKYWADHFINRSTQLTDEHDDINKGFQILLRLTTFMVTDHATWSAPKVWTGRELEKLQRKMADTNDSVEDTKYQLCSKTSVETMPDDNRECCSLCRKNRSEKIAIHGKQYSWRDDADPLWYP